MHDVQVAIVDSDQEVKNDHLYPLFNSGRDKKLVRGVAVTGQSKAPRNVAVRVIEAVAGIAGASSVATGGVSFKDAVHVFNAAFIPGFKSVFPDYTIDQLNRLSDLAFSADSAYKIVIPKNGSVPFVTFISSDTFSQNFKTLHGDKLKDLQRRSYVVVSGVHIVEENDQLKVSKIECPETGAYLSIGAATTDDFTCDVTGANLQLLSTLRLKNAQDSTDASLVDGKVSTASGQNNSAKAVFSVAKLKSLTGAQYAFQVLRSNGNEDPTSITVKLPPVFKITPDTISVSACTSQQCAFTLDGTNLNLLAKISLREKDDDKTDAASGTLNPSTDPKQRNGSINASTLAAKVYRIQAVTVDNQALSTGITLTVNK